MSDGLRVSADELRIACVEALKAADVSEAQAQLVADVLVTTDSWGIFTHGTKLLQHNLKRVLAGGLRTNTEPEIAFEGPAWAIVDGNSVLGHVTAKFAMQTAIEKARVSGIGFAGVRNSCHFGAAGYYAWLAAKENMIGQAMANDAPSMGATGSIKAVLGTNPFAFAAPAREHDPILLDMALSTVAGGKVFAAHQRGEPIPDNWIMGPDGLPSTDGSLYPCNASLVPMAGYKGYGLALMNEILAGVMPGAAFGWGVGSWVFDDPSTPTDHGAAFLAIDIGAMMPIDKFHDRIDSLIREIHAAPTIGNNALMMPGEREWRHRRVAMEEGIELPRDVVSSLRSAFDSVGTSPAWLN
jgi:ureidoglycolate dehydrogenase (NAD+)